MKEITQEQGDQILAYALLLGYTSTSHSDEYYRENVVNKIIESGWAGWIDSVTPEDTVLITNFCKEIIGEGVVFERYGNSHPETLFINWA